jgi:hypothetical protein
LARLEEVKDNRDWGRGENLSRHFVLFELHLLKIAKHKYPLQCHLIFKKYTPRYMCIYWMFMF